MLQRISHKTLCVSYLCPLSICQEELPLWGDVKALHGPGTAASADQQGERSSLQIQQQYQRAQQHLFYLENKCLVMHHENALLRRGHSIDNVFHFNLMEKAFVCCDEIGKAERFTVSRLIAIRSLVQLILTSEENCRPEQRKGRLKNVKLNYECSSQKGQVKFGAEYSRKLLKKLMVFRCLQRIKRSQRQREAFTQHL